MNEPTVLIVEDDAALLRGLRDNFAARGYRVLCADRGDTGFQQAMVQRPSLIVLDVMLPRVSGFDICRQLRQNSVSVPIIMLTAKGQEADIVHGLELGADDYVTKPFRMRELLARAKALLRRTDTAGLQQYCFGDLKLDLVAQRLWRGGEAIPLTTKEYRLLEYFVRNAGRAVTRHQILDAVWGSCAIVSARCVDRWVTTLRGKIEYDSRQPKFIQTVRDVGYRFVGDEGENERSHTA